MWYCKDYGIGNPVGLFECDNECEIECEIASKRYYSVLIFQLFTSYLPVEF